MHSGRVDISGTQTTNQQSPGVDNPENQAAGVMKGKKVKGGKPKKSVRPPKSYKIPAENAVPDKGADKRNVKICTDKTDALNDGPHGAIAHSTGRAAQKKDPYSSVLTDIAAGTGAVSHAVSLGIESYKLSKMNCRKKAFGECANIVNRWQSNDKGGEKPASVEDLQDYAKLAVIENDQGRDTSDPVRKILGENKCHMSSDKMISNLAKSLIAIAGEKTGSRSSTIPKELRGKNITKQLEQWLEAFEQKGKEYTEGMAAATDTGSQKRKQLLKQGHQSKKLMQQFNAIVEPLGVRMNYKTPALKKFGKSAIATRHEFLVSAKKLHDHLSTGGKLPTQQQIKEQILVYKDDAEVLTRFAKYEDRKLIHRWHRAALTGCALLLSPIPMTKLDYFARMIREEEEQLFRDKNLAILNQKQTELSRVFGKYNGKMEGEGKNESSMRKLFESAFWAIDVKKARTKVKLSGSHDQSWLDYAGAGAGTAASILAPGIGGAASDVVVSGLKLAVATASENQRAKVDDEYQQFGRVETKVYTALKNEYRNRDAIISQKDVLDLTGKLFDITTDQAKMLFKQDDDKDLVSARGIIRLRFTSTEQPDPKVVKKIEKELAAEIKGAEI